MVRHRLLAVVAIIGLTAAGCTPTPEGPAAETSAPTASESAAPTAGPNSPDRTNGPATTEASAPGGEPTTEPPAPGGKPTAEPPTPGPGTSRSGGGQTSEGRFVVGFGSMGPLTLGMTVEELTDAGHIEAYDNEGCTGWNAAGEFADGGILQINPDSRKLDVLGGTTPDYRTAEGFGPGNTVGQVRGRYGDELHYDWFRDGGVPIALILTQEGHQIVFLTDRSHTDLETPENVDDRAKIIAVYTSEYSGSELIHGPHSGC